jgi:hypothetical protein
MVQKSMTGTLSLKTKSFVLFFLFSISHFSKAQNIDLFSVSDMVRVFNDGYKMPKTYDTIKLYGIKGEIISGQFVIKTGKTQEKVTLSIAPVRNNKSGGVFPENSIGWNFVGTVPLVKNTPNQPDEILVRKAPARFPDYLIEERQLTIKEKTLQPVWITVTVPETIEEGNYQGMVTVKGNKEVKSIPLDITIYPLTIPSERHLDVVEWYNTSGFERFHGISGEYSPEWFKMLSIYAENMVLHRQNIFQVPMETIQISRSAEGELQFDFTRFDQIAEVFWKTGKMDRLETGELTTFGPERWNSKEIYLKDFTLRDINNDGAVTLHGEEVIPYLIPAFENHLRQKGWLSKTIFGIKDEPSLHNSIPYNRVSAYIHEFAPDLKRYDAIETTNVLNELEIAVPKLDHFSNWYENFINWRNGDKELWFYTVGIYQGSMFPNKTIDVPLIDTRLIHWLNYKYDATGYLHWGWNQWNENPFEDVGMHIGDAWHVYPSKTGVLNSIRWEEMRNGIQDYEYFWLLENSVKELKDSLGSRFNWIIPDQRGKEISGRVIKSFVDRTRDPEVLNKAKMAVIKELLDMKKDPGLYVQTNPPEGSVITDQSTIEVYGWTDPGTMIAVNGRELPVSPQGFFADQFKLFERTNNIVVQATGLRGSKVIHRTYIVKETEVQ